ncbi:dak1 domain-containing protein [Ditylenchus destructor]|nr:dak1 domain-containing protein [Ditylenchus destructor]
MVNQTANDQSCKKKFINDPANSVIDALKGVVMSDETLKFHPNNSRVVIRSDLDELKTKNVVTMVSGGGSGHEPFAAGFVGQNGLTAAVCGDIFASPPSTNVSDAVSAINGPAGTLVFVINYTGDRLHFGMAIERLRAQNPEAKIELVYVDDDVALESKGEGIGRRGLAGSTVTFHIVGCLVEHFGIGFEKAHETASKIISNLGTFGVSLYPCALPGKPPMFQLADDQMELGLGIHGESGLERRKIATAKEIVDVMLQKLVSSSRLKLRKEDRIVVLVNNLGAVSQLELAIVQGEILEWLAKNGFKVERVIVGTLVTSIDGHGFSVTLLKVADPKWLECLDMTSAISKNWRIKKPQSSCPKIPEAKKDKKIWEDGISKGIEIDSATAKVFENCLHRACEAIVEAEEMLNRLDSACGDGDCGSSLKCAAKAIESAAKSRALDFKHPKILLLQLSTIFEDTVGGTSGAIYALMLGASSKAFENSCQSDDFRKAMEMGLHAVVHYGHAKPGYRTLVDPLNAAVQMQSSDWAQIINVVEKTAEDTAKMEAKSGRASYTSSEQQTQPDAGAKALAIWFRAIYESYSQK